MGDRKGFLGALFDLSFTEFVTTRVVKVLYVLTLVLLVIGYIAIAVVIFTPDEQAGTFNRAGQIVIERESNVGLGVLWLVLIGPLLLFLYTLLYRVFYELIIVVFRIYENTRDQLELTRRAVERDQPAP
ncbi:DUF4282 domain-containing protein [Solirubrobacter phytolaccae]|uniref:DUF4282 domain-containing protein n=1 Tax=Solirubrobacter phytolaccae TaxID=1404360 RepID=A0A9X3NGD2_9ACTN|nr:DUF4282 domain-containing protein [Solirubrobacter phytolaccae]MDA0185626.1 DUF4282 domain-containing protein [Solirubrobacter phytolaccae]